VKLSSGHKLQLYVSRVRVSLMGNKDSSTKSINVSSNNKLSNNFENSSSGSGFFSPPSTSPPPIAKVPPPTEPSPPTVDPSATSSPAPVQQLQSPTASLSLARISISDTSDTSNFENSSGISSIGNNFATKTVQLADENAALKKQLNILLRDNADLWEQKLELTDQVNSLRNENTYLTNTLTALQEEFKNSEEAKQVLERRSYALNDLLDSATDTQKILETETDILKTDLSKCRAQKATLMTQFTATLDEVSKLGTEVSAVKEKNYHLLQQLAAITSPSPQEVVKNLIDHNIANSLPAPPYFQLHQFRRLRQKKQLLQEAIASADPFVLRDIVLTLRMGLSDLTFAELIEPFPEAKELYISHATSLGPTAWPSLLTILSYFKMPYEEGMLRLKMALVEAEPTSRLIALHSCVTFFTSHECLRWECERLLEHINRISDSNEHGFTIL